MKLAGLIGSLCFASTCLGGNWFSRAQEQLPTEVQEIVDARSDVGQFDLTYDQDEQGVYELRVMNVSFDRLLSSYAHMSFENQWAREWYHKKRFRQQGESNLMVLANSDLNEVCQYYLGPQAAYAGAYKTEYLRHLRFSLGFVTIHGPDNYSIVKSFGGKKLLRSVSCRLDLGE